MDIKENVSLAPLTTFGIGGSAKHFIAVRSVEELAEALAFAKEKSLKVGILGGGSNVLIKDEGFDGLVIKIEISGVEIDSTTVIAGAGESWDKLVAQTCMQKLWGLENLSGIPGTVGGAVVQNIGAYGAALSEVLLWVEVFDSETSEVKKFFNLECAFGYRDSIFKHESRYIVVRAAFELSATPIPNTSYKDLRALFNDSSPDLSAIREAVLKIRKGKFPDLSIEGTAGSFFKNAIVGAAEAKLLKEKYPNIPLFTMPETEGVKVPLAWFLDYRNGVMDMRNTRIGGARLFEKQPLAIVADKNTRAADVVELAKHVQNKLKEKINLDIEWEVRFF